VAQREPAGARRAGGAASHHDALDAQVVEQGGQRIGLFGQ
jgi:hypothetical protein